jgi:UDPglucose 6-dehydrogenase
VVTAVENVNDQQKTLLVSRLIQHFGEDVRGLKFAVWGLAFKPDTDDIREAPALYMIDALTSAGAEVTAFDPEAMKNVRNLIGDKINYASNEYEALEDADALVICTEWGIFRNPDFKRVSELLKDKVIFDGRNLFDLEEMTEKGYFYASIGRNAVKN